MLVATGHPHAADYPLAMLADEAALVVQRQNEQIVTIGVVVQAAVATTSMGATKETGKNFADILAMLSE